ncbi:general stress protein [Peribacillus sp. SCS-155]|uniref:general stress protein n=1 Tax=Peribacillus sedimenti TaxID=3115297 RepID=UPI003905A9BE
MAIHILGIYDTEHALASAIEHEKFKGHDGQGLSIISKDGENIQGLARSLKVNTKLVGSQELGNERFLNSVKALLMGSDSGTSSGMEEMKEIQYSDKHLEQYARAVFDGKYVLVSEPAEFGEQIRQDDKNLS